MNPYNYRPNVGDVIFLFTDGQPNRRLRAPHFEDTFGFRSETKMASHFANELKKKNITVVGLAAGQNGIINRFYDDLVSWSTYVFRTELTELDLEEVLNKIVAASCKSAGECFPASTYAISVLSLEGLYVVVSERKCPNIKMSSCLDSDNLFNSFCLYQGRKIRFDVEIILRVSMT